MLSINSFLHQYGNSVVFGSALLEESGLPLPATPVFIAAGMAAGAGDMSLPAILGLAISGFLLGDILWFFLGRWRGRQVLEFLCRIALEPDSCVRQTQDLFTRYGLRSLLIAKFLPGFLSTVTPPLAGMSGMRVSVFLLVDSVGALLYGVCFVMLGYCFHNQLQQLVAALASIGGSALAVVAVLLPVTFPNDWVKSIASEPSVA